MVKRELLPDARVQLSAATCTFVYRRLRPGSLHVTITGDDRGDLGTAPLDEILMEFMRQKPIELFVDLRAATGAAVSVSDAWTKFFSNNQENLKRVSILVGSKIISLTVAIAQHLSRTGNLIQIYSDAETFDARVREATPA